MNFGSKTSFIVALALSVTVVCYSTYCFGQNWNKRKCVTLLQPGSCSTAGTSLCQEVAPESCSGSCESCDDTTALPNKVCVYHESSKCQLTGQAGVRCPQSDRWKGSCGMTAGICGCANTRKVGKCGSSDDAYLPCE